jgi:starch phosphorylase
LVRASLGEELGGLVFFLEDYSLELGRLLVQGVDLWLNTPIPPLEASGTSGMKAAMNGALNLSVLDGWWAEGYDGKNGWAIGADEKADGPDAADDLDGDAALRLLDREIAPLFFERDDDGVPRRWLEKVRHSIGTLSHQFDTRRMLQQYRDMAYVPAALASIELRENGFRGAREAVWRNRSLRRGFGELKVAATRLPQPRRYDLGDELQVETTLETGGLLYSQDLAVDLVVGPCAEDGSLDLRGARTVKMDAMEPQMQEPETGTITGSITFRAAVRLEAAGRFAYGVRIRPAESGSPNPALADLVVWG